jgi:hypothetical protein
MLILVDSLAMLRDGHEISSFARFYDWPPLARTSEDGNNANQRASHASVISESGNVRIASASSWRDKI